jgi:alpha-mannosidase
LAFQFEKPKDYPAWNMDWKDREKPPYAYVDGPAKISISEAGPVRVALRVERRAQGSKFVQRICLSAGEAGDSVGISSTIDWQTRQSSLKASFPLRASNPLASYESQSAVIERGNNNPKKFEVPQQMWFDLTDRSGRFGTAILNDCKYGSDKPDDHTVRLTLLYTPGVRKVFQDQATQDIGRHEMVYAIADHAGDWRQADVPWMAARLNQPLRAFVTDSHSGPLGRTFSMFQISNDHVTAMAVKKSEDGDGIVIRLHELDGQNADGVHVKFASPIEQAREVDGQERDLGPADVEDGQLVVNMTPFILRAFKLTLSPPAHRQITPISQPVPLAYDSDAISTRANPADGSFDADGDTYPAEAMPATINREGIHFVLGPTGDGQKNAMICHGQTISLPGGFDRVYILAAADGDAPATFQLGGHPFARMIQNWTGYIGQWDNRLWGGTVPPIAYDWHNPFIGLVPGFINRDTVAWYCDYRHDPQQGNQYYRFVYLFKYGFDLPPGTSALTLPDKPRARIFAVSVGRNTHDETVAAAPLYDTLADRAETTIVGALTISPDGGTFNKPISVRIQHPLYWRAGRLHYTLDGSNPVASSRVYSQPIQLDASATVRAAEFSADGVAGPIASSAFDVHPTTLPASGPTTAR